MNFKKLYYKMGGYVNLGGLCKLAYKKYPHSWSKANKVENA